MLVFRSSESESSLWPVREVTTLGTKRGISGISDTRLREGAGKIGSQMSLGTWEMRPDAKITVRQPSEIRKTSAPISMETTNQVIMKSNQKS